MARRGPKPKPLPGDPTDPGSLTAWMLRYLEALRVRHRSERTIATRREELRLFVAWCAARDLTRPADLTRPILQRYQRHLFYHRTKAGKPLAVSTQHARLVAVRSLFKWLTRENVVLSNPASELDLPRLPKKLPKHVLTPEEAGKVLALPDLDDPIGVRDRAVLELFYSTGIRRMELVALGVFDLDFSRRTLRVRAGKGDKERVVPVGERALGFGELYLLEVRPALVCEPDPGVLFLTRDGQPFSPSRMSQLVRHYVSAADLGKTGSCHLWRHSCATSMLENGADLRYIQEMLGHVELSTTEVYTRVSITKLQEIHAATHPSARLGRRDRGAEDPDPEGEV